MANDVATNIPTIDQWEVVSSLTEEQKQRIRGEVQIENIDSLFSTASTVTAVLTAGYSVAATLGYKALAVVLKPAVAAGATISTTSGVFKGLASFETPTDELGIPGYAKQAYIDLVLTPEYKAKLPEIRDLNELYPDLTPGQIVKVYEDFAGFPIHPTTGVFPTLTSSPELHNALSSLELGSNLDPSVAASFSYDFTRENWLNDRENFEKELFAALSAGQPVSIGGTTYTRNERGEIIASRSTGTGNLFESIIELIKSIGSLFGKETTVQPIVLDLDKDGVEVTFGEDIFFDIDNDRFAEKTSWAGKDDGILVLDLVFDGQGHIQYNADGTFAAGDGKITDAREFAFALWVDPDGSQGITDMQALAMAQDADGNYIFDSYKGDGEVLNSNDALWERFAVWQDADQDGVTDAGELRSMDEAIVNSDGSYDSILSINLTYDDGTAFDDESNDINVFGNILRGLASFTRTDTDEDGNAIVRTDAAGDVALSVIDAGWREIQTDYGYEIEFENGITMRFGQLDKIDGTDVDAYELNLDVIEGDDNDNTIDGSRQTRSLNVNGGAGNDVIYGGAHNDNLSGDVGDDVIVAGDGDDVLYFDAGDTIDGGTGRDTAVAFGETGVTIDMAASGIEVLYGTDGADSVAVSEDIRGAVSIHGNGGDDHITGSVQGDILSGGDGNDLVVAGLGDDMLYGNDGADSLEAKDGDDRLYGQAGNDVMSGDAGDDLLFGGDGADTLSGGTGSDALSGEAGNDSLDGGSGDDDLFGGAGQDTIYGGDGDDDIDGGDGDDYLDGGLGDDRILGGAGHDTITVESGGDDFVNAGDGDDIIYVNGNFQYHEIQGGAGEDTVSLNRHKSDYEIISLYDPNVGQNGMFQYVVIDKVGDHQIIIVQDVEKLVFRADGKWHDFTSNVNPTGNWYEDNSAEYRDVRYGGYDHVGADDFSSDSLDYSNTRWLRAGDDVARMDKYSTTGGKDFANMGAGDDQLDLGGDRDTGYGESGQDFIRGQSGDDEIYGGSGDDYLHGGKDNDILDGNTGDDVIAGSIGYDLISGGDGDDVLDGGSENDTVYGNDGADLIDGSSGNDTLYGGAGDDYLRGGDGDDMLSGETGNDYHKGGSGNDSLYGETGDDRLFGEAGDDVLFGSDGDDFLEGGSGADDLYGGYGRDYLNGGDANDTLDGEGGRDHLVGGSGNDALYGGAENDLLEGGAGGDILVGGDGLSDIASYQSSDAAITINLASGAALGGDAAGDMFVGIEGIIGSDFNDQITGDTLDNELYGGNGDDQLQGGDGRDILSGEDGDDILSGGGEDDNLFGGIGNDYLFGGAANDVLAGGFHNDTLEGGLGNDRLYGDYDADSLIGNEGDDSLYGGHGDDVLSGGLGADLMEGGSGNDTANYAGSSAITIDLTSGESSGGHADGDTLSGIEVIVATEHNDQLIGDRGDNSFIGGDGDDFLSGKDGDDLLIGGLGADQLVGGNGNDIVSYDGSSAVTIDLSTGEVSGGHADGDILSNIEGVIASAHDDVVTGDQGDNMLSGGAGDDTLRGEAGDDSIVGGAGNDYLVGGEGADVIYAGLEARVLADTTDVAGADTVHGDFGDDTIHGADAAQELLGDGGNDWIYGGNEGSTSDTDTILGGAGNDRLFSGYDGPAGQVGDYLDGQWGIDTVVGGMGDDTLIGGDENDNLDGGGGDDEIYVGQITGLLGGTLQSYGVDTARGGDGDDLIIGSNGANQLRGDAGDDTISGGNDGSSSDTDTILGGEGNDWLYSGQTVTPSSPAYQARGDYMLGENGNDHVHGGTADDTLDGGNGADWLSGGAGADWISGGDDRTTADADTLLGGAGNDTLVSGQGMTPTSARQANGDVLDGGAGDDLLIGGLADDTFVFAADGGVDTVQGFAQGADGIDLTGFGAGSVVAFAQAGADVEMSVDGTLVAVFEDGGAAGFGAEDYWLV